MKIERIELGDLLICLNNDGWGAHGYGPEMHEIVTLKTIMLWEYPFYEFEEYPYIEKVRAEGIELDSGIITYPAIWFKPVAHNRDLVTELKEIFPWKNKN